MSSKAGIYFDGVTSNRRDVAVALAPSSLRISAQDGRLLTEWPYDEIRGWLRLTMCSASAGEGARRLSALEFLIRPSLLKLTPVRPLSTGLGHCNTDSAYG